MGVARERERDPIRHLRENVGLMDEEHHRVIGRHLGERPGKIVDAAKIAMPQRMGKLVDDMLRLARLDQHPGQQCEPVNLTDLVSDCFDEAASADPRRTWRADIADDLAVTGDAELLRRAVTNLLGNITTHTPEGTTATLTAARSDGHVVIGVSDNGAGLPAGQLPRIFDRFYRGTAPSPRPGARPTAETSALTAAPPGRRAPRPRIRPANRTPPRRR